MSIETPRIQDPLPTDFKEAYRWALHSVLRFKEGTASIRLKHAFKYAMAPDPKDNTAISIHNDLNERTRNLMYGDYKSDSAYPWINDPIVLTLIVCHARILGEDEQVIADFLARTKKAYGDRAAPGIHLAA